MFHKSLCSVGDIVSPACSVETSRPYFTCLAAGRRRKLWARYRCFRSTVFGLFSFPSRRRSARRSPLPHCSLRRGPLAIRLAGEIMPGPASRGHNIQLRPCPPRCPYPHPVSPAKAPGDHHHTRRGVTGQAGSAPLGRACPFPSRAGGESMLRGRGGTTSSNWSTFSVRRSDALRGTKSTPPSTASVSTRST